MQSAELALQRSREPAVRAYAQTLLNDHQNLLNRTSMAIELAGVPVPSSLLQPRHFSLFQQLQTIPSAGFDETYRNIQVMVHIQAIDLQQRYAMTGDNAGLRALASETVPVLHAHLASAQRLRMMPLPRYRASPRAGERG